MMVTFCDSSAWVLGSSGLTNAYRSVLSAAGSWLISGASRWLEALAASGPEPRTSATVTAAASPRTTRKARAFLCIPSPSLGVVAAYSHDGTVRFAEPERSRSRMSPDGRVSVERAFGAEACIHGEGSRTSLRRSARRAGRPHGRPRAGGALRPLRARRVRAGAPDRARTRSGGGRRAGGIPDALALREPLRPRAGQGEHVDPHSRPSARRRHRAARAAATHGADRGCATGKCEPHRGRGLAPPPADSGTEGATSIARPAARGARARLFRRLHAIAARREAR